MESGEPPKAEMNGFAAGNDRDGDMYSVGDKARGRKFDGMGHCNGRWSSNQRRRYLSLNHLKKKENGKEGKKILIHQAKVKDRKEKVTDASANSSSHVLNHMNGRPHPQAEICMDRATGDPYWQLLERNSRILDKVTANIIANKSPENINLLWQARNNLLTCINILKEEMRSTPPLDLNFDMDEELVIARLPPASLQKKK